MKINLFDAGNGDALLLESEDGAILFDGGTTPSYERWVHKLKPFSKLDAVFITHIDNDHANGVIKLLESNGSNDSPQVIKIEKIYFNGIEQILDGNLSSSNEYAMEMDQIASLSYDEINEQKIGYSEGTSLSYIIHQNKYNINPEISGQRFCRETIKELIISDFNIEIIGPSNSCLDKMKEVWMDKIKLHKIRRIILNKKHSIAFERYISKFNDDDELSGKVSSVNLKTISSLAQSKYVRDTSLNNKSSISLYVKYKKSSVLMLGDCHGEQVIDWLNENKVNTFSTDAVKLPHHGSVKNFPEELIKRIDCEKFIISTNGEQFNHPDEELIAKIIYFSQNNELNFYFNLPNENFNFNFFNKNNNGKKIKFHITEKVEL